MLQWPVEVHTAVETKQKLRHHLYAFGLFVWHVLLFGYVVGSHKFHPVFCLKCVFICCLISCQKEAVSAFGRKPATRRWFAFTQLSSEETHEHVECRNIVNAAYSGSFAAPVSIAG